MAKKKTASASPQEIARGVAADQMRGEFERDLMALPGAVARGEAQTGALGLRGRGRGMYSAGQTRGLGAQIGAATAQAGLEAKSKQAEIQKQNATNKKTVMQEIEELRKAGRYDKQEVLNLKAVYGGDQEMLDFIDAQAGSAPNKSQSKTDSEKTLGDDIKSFTKYLGF
tara:strand:- start:32387 stop:32893 length:507 start_codon:yes stop_codon:yes gene_type:complete